ncbi:glycosyltransferase, partial [Acinetobacter baumannii]
FFSKPTHVQDNHFTPTLTLVVAAYNEEEIIEAKIENTLQLQYPADKLQLLFVTDGSTDATADIIARFPQINLLHQEGRSGKI